MADFSTDINKYSPELNSLLGGWRKDRTDFYGGQKAEEQDYLERYKAAVAGQETLPAMYQRISDELQLPALRKNYNTLNTTLMNIPYTYGKATAGYDVNANQLARITSTKSAALTPEVQALGNQLTAAEEQLTNRMTLGEEENARLLSPYEKEQTLLSDRLAREQSGFTTEMESKLTGYLEKMKGGIALSTTELEEANKLAIAKLDYDAKKYAADKQLEGTKYTADAAKSSWY